MDREGVLDRLLVRSPRRVILGGLGRIEAVRSRVEVSVSETEAIYQGRPQEGSTEGEASAGGGGGMLLFKY